LTKSRPTVVGHRYRLKFVPSAWKEWQALDGSIREPLRKLLKKRLDEPHAPGGALHGELEGYYKIKLLKQGVRLVYAVEDDVLIVMVMAIDRREDNLVYRSALTRLEQTRAGLSIAAEVRPAKSPRGKAKRSPT
jgi:mRNA interferase RelE/StbE